MAWIIDTGPGQTRLEADAILTPADFRAIAAKLDTKPVEARKTGYVAARLATRREVVETRWDGKETTNTARVGDWIVTNLSPQREVLRDSEGHLNTYVVAAERFNDLYESAPGRDTTPETAAALGTIHRAKGIVSALPLPGGFDILAPWGERQTAPAGYLLLNREEVYGNNAETFAATHE